MGLQDVASQFRSPFVVACIEGRLRRGQCRLDPTGEAYQALAQAFGSLGLDEKAKDQAELAKRVPLLANFSDPRLSNPAPALGARERLREAERLARRVGLPDEDRAAVEGLEGRIEAHVRRALSKSFATATLLGPDAAEVPDQGVAVALDATLVRMMLLPSILRLLGPVTWWLPGNRSGPKPEPAPSTDE